MRTPDDFINEQECARLYSDFTYAVDNHLTEEAIQLFTEDGVFERLGERISGHEMLRSFFASRDPANQSHHVCANIRITLASPTSAIGTCTVMLFTPGETSPTCTLAKYDDTFQLTPSGWKIKERIASLVF